jgi:putative transposase
VAGKQARFGIAALGHVTVQDTQMAKKKRHTAAEIMSKLEEAAALSAKGMTQSEIARALGISIMTFHRWRNAKPSRSLAAIPRALSVPEQSPVASLPEQQRQSRIAALQLENLRLRKLVTDLLLEKMSLEDEAQRVLGRQALKERSG